MKVREYNEQIEILNLKKIIEYVKDGVTSYIMPSEYSTEESMANELIDAGFVDTIDAPLKENQYLGEVYKKDGKFYRDAIDNPLPPPIPEPTINIDSRTIKTEIGELFEPRGFDFQNNYPMIMDNLKDAPIPMYRKNMENLKTYSLGYKLTGLITDAEFTAFRQIFIDNGFDLNDY
jgi:hypothetical protein